MRADQRRQLRRSAYAKVMASDHSIPGYLRDLSAGGVRVALLHPVPIPAGRTLRLAVLPLPEAGIEPFPLAVIVRWSRRDPIYQVLGGNIHPPARPRHLRDLRRLLAYYAES